MKYQYQIIDGRTYRFTGRRLQVRQGGKYLDVFQFKSSRPATLTSAHRLFADHCHDQGLSVSEFIEYHLTAIR